jgi:SPX domain protein involved in polyphosphate accumulation
MKFGKTISQTSDSEWAQAGLYVDYRRLKKQIKKIVAARASFESFPNVEESAESIQAQV